MLNAAQLGLDAILQHVLRHPALLLQRLGLARRDGEVVLQQLALVARDKQLHAAGYVRRMS